jgi:hypothetical protein
LHQAPRQTTERVRIWLDLLRVNLTHAFHIYFVVFAAIRATCIVASKKKSHFQASVESGMKKGIRKIDNVKSNDLSGNHMQR